MPADGLQYAGHTHEGSEGALINWILGVPKKLPTSLKALKENSAVVQ